MSISSKPAILDGSLLFARKGEAIPAITATLHNNPGYVWGQALHPDDFQAEIYPLYPDKSVTEQTALKTTCQTDKHTDTIDGNSITIALQLDVEMLMRIQYVAQNSNNNIHQIIREAIDRDLQKKGASIQLNLSVQCL